MVFFDILKTIRNNLTVRTENRSDLNFINYIREGSYQVVENFLEHHNFKILTSNRPNSPEKSNICLNLGHPVVSSHDQLNMGSNCKNTANFTLRLIIFI